MQRADTSLNLPSPMLTGKGRRFAVVTYQDGRQILVLRIGCLQVVTASRDYVLSHFGSHMKGPAEEVAPKRHPLRQGPL